MPLTPELDALLSSITDATKREGLRKELESGYLRQSDYSRKMNELTETEATRASAYAKGINWVESNRQNYSQALSERDLAIKKATEAEQRVAALGQAADTGIQTADTLDIDISDEKAVAKAILEARKEAAQATNIAKSLVATVTKLNGMMENGDLVTRDVFEQEAGKRLESFSRATMDVMSTLSKAKSEYGIDVDRDTLLTEAAKFGGDLGKAYESVTSSARMDKIRSDITKQVTEEVEAKYRNNQGNPLASGAPPLMGPLQAMIDGQRNPESSIDPNIPADGSGRLARAIAAELRAEGKF